MSVGALSSSTTSSLFGSTTSRISGLASGLDIDGLVEGMTLNTQSKIAQQYQAKQLLQWEMDDYRTISEKLIAFQQQFTSFSSSTNLRSNAFFASSSTTALGDNSKYISVTGSSSNAENITIAAVEKLATAASVVGGDMTPKYNGLRSDVVNEEITTSTLAGSSLTIEYESKKYTIYLDEDKTYDTAEELAEEINKQFADKECSAAGADTLADVIKVSVTSDKKLSLEFASDEIANKGGTVRISKGSDALLEAVGWEAEDEMNKNTDPIVGENKLTDAAMDKTQEKKSFSDLLTGTKDNPKTITFSYNGKEVEIEMPTKFESSDFEQQKEELCEYLTEELRDAFGDDTIEEVKFGTSGRLNIYLQSDDTSVLEITGGDDEALKALGFSIGDSNGINMTDSLQNLADRGFAISGLDSNSTEKKDLVLKINGVEIKDSNGKNFTSESSMEDIIKAINESDAGVKVNYIKETNKFSIVSSETGAAGKIEIQSQWGGELTEGTGDTVNLFNTAGSDVVKGTDAEIWVDYDGAGGMEAVKIKRASNTFDISGMSVTVKNTFGVSYEEGTPIFDQDAAVTFESNIDSEKITTAVKDMITAFNDIIKLTNDELSEKPERDYPPLTDQQKEEMSESEIENWETEAKKGMLFNSSELRSFTSAIRFVFSGSPEQIEKLEEMGISVSSNYSDNGKINFDEEKFKSYIEKNGTSEVAKLFTETSQTTVDENGNEQTTKGGIMTQLYTIFEDYAATTGATKGIFVEKAGATAAPLSLLDNTLQDQIDEIDDYIEQLQSKLEDETERYYQQFSSLETYISNMNTQSGWLMQQFG